MRLRIPIAIISAVAAASLPAADLHVGDGFPYTSISAALAAARDDDTILVHGGRHAEGNLRVTKPLHLVGIDSPVLDGCANCEVLTIAASGVTVRGFVITNTGRSSTSDQAGIRVDSASNVTIENNRLTNCHFAIYLGRARDCRVLRNEIEGVTGIEQNCGNGVHLWNCEGIDVKENSITGHRDGIYLEFASRSTVERNEVAGNLRYGLHFMYSHDSGYHGNRFSKNGAGVAVMYSRHVDMSANRFDFNWGSSAYGLLLKDITDSSIVDNVFDHNSTAVYAQGASRVVFERNQFLQNGWALRILASGDANTFRKNDFAGNSFDVGTNGQLSSHEFANNYWDRYEGYDLNRDSLGDVPFQPVNLYAILVERVPASVLLLRSFMVHLLDRAEKAFPSITPDSVADHAPSCRPNCSQTAATFTPSAKIQPEPHRTTMKTPNLICALMLTALVGFMTSCGEKPAPAGNATPASPAAPPGAGQAAVADDTSEKDVVKVAVGSPDHTTLVKAVQAADLVNVLANAGPFTVFAPTNAAFDKLPAGTVENLLKPENKDKLADILQYHVAVGGYKAEMLRDGQILNMANSGNVTVSVKDGKISINGANIVATVKASNGIVHVVDAVILQPAAK